MSELLDSNKKQGKNINYFKIVVKTLAVLFLLQGTVGVINYFYSYDSFYVNLTISAIQLYLGYKFLKFSHTSLDLIITLFVLFILSFNIYTQPLLSIIRNGIYLELDIHTFMFKLGFDYSTLIVINVKMFSGVYLAIDIFNLALFFLVIFVSFQKLKINRRDKV